MATKKAAVTTKKSTAKPQTITKVTAVESAKTPVQTVSTVASTKQRLVLAPTSVGSVIAEFVGTFIFAAGIIASQGSPVIVGFMLVALVLAVNSLSAAHFNPALSIAAWLTRRISGIRAVAYVVAQVLGAMLALVVLNWFAHANGSEAVTDPATGQSTGAIQLFAAAAIPEAKEWYVFAAEVLGGFIFGFAVASMIRIKELSAKALTMGFGFFTAILIASSAAGVVGATTILNPAVAVSLQALSFNVWPIAIYIVGPIVGAIIGFTLFDFLKKSEVEKI